MCFTQFFILSLRGDTIISRDYRGDIAKGSPEAFFRHVKTIKTDAHPIFLIDGISFVYIKQNGLYFVITTRRNVSPTFSLELLNRIAKIFKDYCGVVTEEAIRKNFVLIYELLDEILDFGYAQSTTTETLKAFVYSDPVTVDATTPDSFVEKMIHANLKTTPSHSANKPVQLADSRSGILKTKEEIFVDLIERQTVLFSAGGSVLRAEIDGSIVMKSFLRGNPELRLGLNEDLVLGKGARYGRVTIEDINFHECVRYNSFELDKSITFRPPDGEFVVLNYRISDDFKIPFRISPFIEELDPKKFDVIIKVRMDTIDKIYGTNVIVRLPVPKNTAACSGELANGAIGQTFEYKASERTAIWNIKKFPGESEQVIKVKVTLGQAAANARKEFGPISMMFEIPMHTCSNVQIRYLKVNEGTGDIPFRWVRYITQSASYVYRL